MTIDATCDSCFRTYQLKEKLAGRKVRCKECGEVFTVPRPGAAPAADPWETEDPFDDDPYSDGPAPPPRPAKRRKKRSSGKKSRRSQSSGLPLGWIGILSLVGGVMFLLMCVVGIFFRPVLHLTLVGLGLTGGVLAIVGGVGLLMAAFEEDTMVGVLYLLMPFYPLYFCITRIGEVWKLVLMNVGGSVLAVSAIMISGVVTGFDEARNRAGQQGFDAPIDEGGGIFADVMAAVAQDDESEYQLREMAVGMHDYHDTFMQFPPRPEDDADQPLVSWQTALLPFVDENGLYQQIDPNTDWDAPANNQAISTEVEMYMQRSISESTNGRGHALSHYALNQNFLRDSAGFRIRDITDGVSNTAMSGEVGGGYKAWADPSNVRDVAAGLVPGPDTFGNPSGAGGFMSLADGSVRWFSSDTDPEVLKALSTPDGAEPF